MATQPHRMLSDREDEPTSVDDWLRGVGEFGPYQRRHFAIVTSAWFFLSWGTLSMVFVNTHPGWRMPNSTIVSTKPPPCGDKSHPFELVDPHTTIQGDFRLVCDREWLSGLTDSLYFVGFGIGASLLGWLSDRYGRRLACAIASLVFGVAALASAAAPTLPVFAALRLVEGIGVGGAGTCVYVLAAECIGPSWQGAQGLMQMAIFAVGGVCLVVPHGLLRGWRALTVATAVPPFAFAFIFLRLVPESPRWLLANGRTEAAARLLFEIARVNRADVDAPPTLAPPRASADASSGLADLVLTPGIRRRTLAMAFLWAAGCFAYYGLALSADNLGGSLEFNFALMSAIELPGLAVGAGAIDRFGRRATLSVCYAGGGLAAAACVFLPEGNPTVFFAILGKCLISAAFGVCFVYAAELFPTTLRAAGMGVASTAARVGAGVAPTVVLLGGIASWLPLLIFGVVSLAAAVVTLALPETLGRPLPETVADCEETASMGSAHRPLSPAHVQ